MDFSLKSKIGIPFKVKTKEEIISVVFDTISEPFNCQFDDTGSWIVWIGDFVLSDGLNSIEDLLRQLLGGFKIESQLMTAGNYYCICYDATSNKLSIHTGFLNIMPIYYYDQKESETVFIASKPIYISEQEEVSAQLNRKFVLEKMLFNFPFQNETIYNEIKMLGGNHYLSIDQTGCKELKHTNILDWVVDNPVPAKKSLPDLVELLNNRIDSYLPGEDFYLSFTSGFDGRTILSRALRTNKQFKAYAFGTKITPDITIPGEQAKQLNFPFIPFFLDEDDYQEKALEYGLELVDKSSASSNFARAHYVYAADKISKTHNYIVTGNFGSELFRAFHVTGVMVTPFLFGLFQNDNTEQFLDTYTYPEFLHLNEEFVKENIVDLKHKIALSEVFKKNGTFTKNQVFYSYIFEHVLRKYFGAELVLQSDYLINRTPFLDYLLIREIFRTELAGIYSEFYENNPARRLKGQMLYSYFIKSNSPQLYMMKTGKGYSPKSVISSYGKFYLVWNLLRKKIFSVKNMEKDEFGVSKVFEGNREYFLNQDWTESIFSKQKSDYNKYNNGMELNNIISVLSLNWYINKHFGCK